jgi:hypothetical protein
VTHTRIAAALFAAVALTACAAPYAAAPTSQSIATTPETNAEVAKYLRIVKATRPGAFAVSPDGRNSFFTYCEEIACAVTNYSQPALRGCQSFTGAPCVILYVRDQPRLPFSRTQTAGTGGRHGSEEQRELDFDLDDRRS